MKEEKVFEVNKYISVLRKKLLLVILFTLFTTGIAYIYSFFIAKPLYSSTSTIIIGKDTNNKTDILTQGDVLMYQNLIKTYTQIAKSKVVATKAANILKTEMPTKELMKNMKVSSVLDSQVISITYQSNNSKDAAEYSNAFATAFINQSQVLLPSGMAQIMDKAEENKIPVKPNKTVNVALSFVIGFILSIGLVFFLDFLDNTIKNEDDVRKYLNIPTVGIIPIDSKIEGVIVDKDPRSPITEAFKSMRTNLLFSLKNREIRTLIVCSSVPNEGKSTICTNIGAAISQTGKKVLIVDCDLRRPSIHRVFNLSNQKGLMNVIFDEINLDDTVTMIHENLFVLTSGEIPYNPSELLYSQRMKKFIKDMEAKYDYVILDTPPIIIFADTIALVDEKVGMVLVVNANSTKIEICRKAENLLRNVDATILGAVLNKVDKKSVGAYGYNYYSNDIEKEKK